MDYDETVNKSVADRELKRFSNVVESHVTHTTNVLNTLEPKAIFKWSAVTDAIQYGLENQEKTPEQQLVKSDHSLVSKVVLALSQICKELSNLVEEAETNLYIPLVTYKESVKITSAIESHSGFIQILPHLQKIKCFIAQTQQAVSNVVLQLNSLHTKDSDCCISIGAAHFQVVYEHLGRLLATLIVLDEILCNSRVLNIHWSAFKKLVKSIQTDSGRFSIEKEKLVNLGRMINELQEVFMQGSIFKHFLHSFAKNKDVITQNTKLKQETVTVILGWCSQVENSIAEGWVDCQQQVLSLTALSLFHSQFFNVHDKKLAKALLILYRKVPCITLCGCLVFNGEQYIKKHFPQFAATFNSKVFESLQSNRSAFMEQKITNIASEYQAYNSKITMWMVELSCVSYKCPSQLTRQDLVQRAAILLQGLTTAYSLRYLVQSILSLQAAANCTFTRSCALYICRMVELLKCVQCTYHNHTSALVETLPHLRQFLSYQILSLIQTTRDKLQNESKPTEQTLETAAAFSIAQDVLWASGTKDRQLIGRISLSLANQNKAFMDEDFVNLLSLMKRIALANDIQSHIMESTDASFISYHPFVLPTYLEDFYRTPDNVHRIHLMIAAVKDHLRLLSRPNCPLLQTVIDQFSSTLKETLRANLLQWICEAVEDELRLTSNPHLPGRNPLVVPFKSLWQLLHLAPINLGHFSICVKDYVEHYLQKVFYNLTVVAPQDCSVYESMRHIAASVYGLHILPSHLPSQTVEQVVDILETVRNIHVFVEKYQYNMNQQFFIESRSQSNYLTTVTIEDISNSIQTHGCGIINTTVNFTYQFLRGKFNILSEFLYDELIKSPLLKSLQHWREVKNTRKSFPYEKAEKFNRGIRKLGLTSDGLSYLDQLRKLVTQTGNAIGFVRLVRCGGLHFSGGATQFIPDLQDCASFLHLSKDVAMSAHTQQTVTLLDAMINEATGSLHLDTDYLKMMVEAFSSALQNDKLDHLRNFYLIVPALTINFVENVVSAKHNLQKRIKNATTFTDDGFALGVAYLLATLGQVDIFESLHWWDSIRHKFRSQKQKIETQLQDRSIDGKLKQTLTLTLSRLTHYEHEFDYLYLSIRSAAVFFNKMKSKV